MIVGSVCACSGCRGVAVLTFLGMSRQLPVTTARHPASGATPNFCQSPLFFCAQRLDHSIVNFDNFGSYSLDIYLSCYTRTCDWAEYHACRERILLAIGAIINQRHADFAFPTSTLWLNQDQPTPTPTHNYYSKSTIPYNSYHHQQAKKITHYRQQSSPTHYQQLLIPSDSISQ